MKYRNHEEITSTIISRQTEQQLTRQQLVYVAQAVKAIPLLVLQLAEITVLLSGDATEFYEVYLSYEAIYEQCNAVTIWHDGDTKYFMSPDFVFNENTNGGYIAMYQANSEEQSDVLHIHCVFYLP